MIPLSSTANQLTWSRIPHTRNYQLRANGQTVGTLSRPSFWSSSLIAETANGKWNLRRAGVFNAGSEIVDFATGQSVANFQNLWGKGLLTFADGLKLRLRSSGCVHPVWTILSEAGQPILRLDTRQRSIEISAPAHSIPQDRLPLLMMFVWYRKLQADEEAAAVLVVAAS